MRFSIPWLWTGAFLCLVGTGCGPEDNPSGSDATVDAAAPTDAWIDAAAPSDGAVDAAPPTDAWIDATVPSDGAVDAALDGALDCDADPGCQTGCTTIPAPALVDNSPLPGETTPGVTQTVTAGGFTDDYLYNSAHSFKVGTRREWGGTIIFFGMDNGSAGLNNTNTIDANDTGREVQVAFYDPDRHMQNCAWNASCQSTTSDCANSITFLGWNPVQGGNRCNNGSGVESVDLTGGALTVTTRPLFWNPNWDRQDCSDAACSDPSLNTRESDVRVIQRLRFVREHVVELFYTVNNLSALDHATTAQEFPTVYTANGNAGPDLWRLFNSSSTEITIDTPGNDGFYYENFTSAGGWVAMQNDNLDYGVGMYTESKLQSWQGWQLRSLPFNNFRPIFSFGIPSNGTVFGRSYLILGNLSTVAAEATWLDDHLPPFGVIDEPVPDASVSGSITVRGWALDNKGVAAVDVRVDGGSPVALTYGTSRPDVCRVWPTYAGCDSVGYTGTLDTSTLSDCPHLLEVTATDGDGNSRVIARQRILVTP